MATKTNRPRGKQSERLSVRLRAEHKDLIEEAALLRGESLSSFAVSTLVKEAEDVLERENRLVLMNKDRDRFLAALDNPPAPNARLLEAGRLHAEHVEKSGK